ncbi:MAG TPA: ATP-binding protein [Terriglobales bacterium]
MLERGNPADFAPESHSHITGKDQNGKGGIRKVRVLVVEDSESDVELALHALEADGFLPEHHLVQTPAAFLDRIHKNSYDVVLADYRIPGWNGMETVDILRREGLDIPVIVVSGALGDLKAVECIKQGAADYVLKDHLPRLAQSVQRAIEDKQLRDAHRQAQEDLARSNRDLEQFAYVASHDLQEPLRMVAAYTQLLDERYRGKLDEQADKYIHYAMDGAMRMQTLISDLLAFSRVGRQGSEPEPADCNLVVQSAMANLQTAIQESEARVQVDQLPTIAGCRFELVQLFQNLIGNAIKFRSSVPPQIHISAKTSGTACLFAVSDNGIGILPEHAETIFAIFKRLHTHVEYPGSGIGLAICKKIVEQHGGRIWVEPSPGEGSAFKFILPIHHQRRAYDHTAETRS